MAVKVRVDYRLEAELAEWVEAQAVEGRTRTDVVEEALRLARSRSTGVSRPTVPAAGSGRSDAFRSREAKRG